MRLVTATTCVLLFVIVTTCARDVTAMDAMGAALEDEDDDTLELEIADSLAPLTTKAAAKEGAGLPNINARQQAALAAVNKQSDHLAELLSTKHRDDDEKKKKKKRGVGEDDEGPDAPQRGNENAAKDESERPMLGVELSPAQLEAIGLTTSPPLDTEKDEPESKKESEKPKVAINMGNTSKEAPLKKDEGGKTIIPNAITSTTEEEIYDLKAAVAANMSIDHVEAHLHILQQLELSVAQSIEEMNAKVNSRHAKPSRESKRISQELQVLKVLFFVHYSVNCIIFADFISDKQ